MPELELVFVDSIAEIGDKDWNRLAGTKNPFMRYEFLYALESTACTTFGNGLETTTCLLKAKIREQGFGWRYRQNCGSYGAIPEDQLMG